MKWYEINEMSVEKWRNEICGKGEWEKPRENPMKLCFVHHKTQMEWSRKNYYMKYILHISLLTYYNQIWYRSLENVVLVIIKEYLHIGPNIRAFGVISLYDYNGRV